MPGPFTHIYGARRVSDYLMAQRGFVRPQDGPLDPAQKLAPASDATRYGQIMARWPKYTALGSLGPDLFFFCMDFQKVPGDEVMLAMAALYLVDDSKRQDWEPLIAILDGVDHTMARVLRLLIKLDKIWNQFKDVWQRTVGHVLSLAEKVVDELTGGMLTTLEQGVKQLGNDLEALVGEYVLTNRDIFDFFTPILQKGYDEQAFLWSDMLHYRKTSQMGANLLKRANAMADPTQREQFLAYALGFVCHLGIDVTGHAFVNEQSGTCFRDFGQRHHAIENHIDAWNYHQTAPGRGLPVDSFCAATPAFPMLSRSALYFAVQLTPERPNGDQRPGHLPPEGTKERTAALDTDGTMPDWLARGIVEALIDTYYDPAHPNEYPALLGGSEFQKQVTSDPALVARIVQKRTGKPIERPVSELMALLAPSSSLNVPPGFPLPWEIQVTYRFMLTFFKRAYMDSFDLPKPPGPTIPPFPTLRASDFSWDYHPTDPPIKQLQEIVNGIGKDLEAAAKWVGHLFDWGSKSATLPAREIFYQNVTLPLWRSVRGHRDVLVKFGFLQPQDREVSPSGELLHESEIEQIYYRLGYTGLPQTRNPRSSLYPYMHLKDGFHRPYAYPSIDSHGKANHIEQYRTTSGPYPVNATADILLSTTGVASNPLRFRYERATSPAETDQLNERYVGHGEARVVTDPLGDPAVFSAYLIGRIAGDPAFAADFNLDADRGYGYLCWDWNRTTTMKPGFHGRSYRQPCVLPQDAATTPVQLHYKATPVAGCHAPVSPDSLLPLSELVVTATPATIALGKPTHITVHAIDSKSRQPVEGTVTIVNYPRGHASQLRFPTNTQSPEITFEEFPSLPSPLGHLLPVDLEDRLGIRHKPKGTVAALGYLLADVPLKFETAPPAHQLVTGFWPATVTAGRPVAVTIQAADSVTHAPVDAEVLVNGRPMGHSNTPFTFTFGLTPPAGTLRAAGYPETPIHWPAIVPSRFITQATPHQIELGKPVQVLVMAVDADTRQPVAAHVMVRNFDTEHREHDMTFPANVPSPPITFNERPHKGPRVELLGLDLAGGPQLPSMTVNAPGYTSQAVDVRFGTGRPQEPTLRRRLVVSVRPATPPVGKPVRLTVKAEDARTHKPVAGTVELTYAGPAGRPQHKQFDANEPSPEITFAALEKASTKHKRHRGATGADDVPRATIKAAGYAEAKVEIMPKG